MGGITAIQHAEATYLGRRVGVPAPAGPIRLGVVDDHEAIRLGVVGAAVLDARTADVPIRVTKDTATVDGLIGAGEGVCQVVALDLALGDGSSPGMNVHRLLGHGCKVIVFSLADDPEALRDALSAGAAGYVRKSEPTSRLLEMVREVHAGRQVVCREFAAMLDDDQAFSRSALTEKEREAVGLYASGLSIDATAARMGCTPATAKTYVDRAKAKYQAQDRPATQKVQLFINAIKDGILPPVIPGSR
ncbi:two-component system response regulator DevR [Sinomonas notoginsengisoli]|uniref:sigma factor-like helix-turn-helix DNA-binding protein n=1 Tax=Sinomonas notoginsengisoli TaxID=1457311 RepID=UPI001F1B4316|nr:response regulator transcription factor [Sinomonas notoginsengisoli]